MNKTVIITGGTGGIGVGIANELFRTGWHVIATGINNDELEAFRGAREIERRVLDVTDQSSVDGLFASVGRLDGLVNCAGIIAREAEYDLDVFQKVIAVNLTGTMRCCLAAHPLLRDTGGSIVNTASMLSVFGGPLVPAYSASKGGVTQLTKALAGKWAADGIRVNAVAPGWIETEMTEALRQTPERNEAIMARTPMNRWGKSAEVGALVDWLLSDKASFVTGVFYPVDGGYMAI